MKTKILVILIIISSIFSWMIGSFFVLNYMDYDSRIIYNKKEENINSEKIKNLENLEDNITSLVKNISPSVVSIIIKKDLALYKSDPWWFFREYIWSVQKKVWWWTWFFVTKDGLIITNRHVISDNNSEYSVITNDKKEFVAKVIAIDPITDLAILKIKWDNFIPLTFIDNEDNIKIWQFAIAIWNALAEFQNSVSFWVVSWKNRSIKDENINLSNLIQTDTAINPWNSWWPLINLKWEVMWINTAIVNWSQSIWFSIWLTKKKVNYILDSIEKYDKIKRPFLWINYIILSDSLKNNLWINVDYWAYIVKENWVLSGSNSQKAWLEWWDIILEIDWIKLTLENDLNQLLQDKIPWDKINLKVMKSNWDLKNIDVALGEI